MNQVTGQFFIVKERDAHRVLVVGQRHRQPCVAIVTKTDRASFPRASDLATIALFAFAALPLTCSVVNVQVDAGTEQAIERAYAAQPASKGGEARHAL